LKQMEGMSTSAKKVVRTIKYGISTRLQRPLSQCNTRNHLTSKMQVDQITCKYGQLTVDGSNNLGMLTRFS